MERIYNLLFIFTAVFVIDIALSACSKNQEDIAAPIITYTYPAENDTIQLVNNSITLRFIAKDDVKIDKMSMDLICQTEYYTYSTEFAEYNIDSQYFDCAESCSLYGISKITQMRWILFIQNEFHNWRRIEIDFYAKP